MEFLLTCLLRGMTADFFTQYRYIAFLLTCLLRGMTSSEYIPRHLTKFLLTCLLRGMTTKHSLYCMLMRVSTHMPLARHDDAAFDIEATTLRFYSHASCEA